MATEGVHIQYPSPPHQHDPGLVDAGCPPCQVLSCPCEHAAEEDSKEADDAEAEDVGNDAWKGNHRRSTARIMIDVATAAMPVRGMPPALPLEDPYRRLRNVGASMMVGALSVEVLFVVEFVGRWLVVGLGR